MTQNINDYEDFAEESKSYEQAPEGPHKARCIEIIQLGTQKGFKEGDYARRKILIGWELSADLHIFNKEKGPQPYYITNTYNLVLNEKSNYTIHIEAWLNKHIDKSFNYFTLLGKECILTIKHKASATDSTKIRARITAIAPLMSDQTCPAQINPFKVLTFRQWNQSIFDALPKWIKTQIEVSPEYKNLLANEPLSKDNMEGKFPEKKNPVDPYNAKVPPITREEILNAEDVPY